MRSSRRSEGAATIVTVLFLAVMLSVLLTITLTVALSSRRVTTDQRAALQAQYAAESGIARAQARMEVARALLQQLTFNAKSEPRDVEAEFRGLCGGGRWLEENLSRPIPDARVGLPLCQGLNGNDRASRQKLIAFLTSRIRSEDYQAYGIRNRVAFWEELLDGTPARKSRAGGTAYESSVGLRLTGLSVVGVATYRLEYAFTDAESSGVFSGPDGQELARSKVILGRQEGVPHWLTFNAPSFSRWALFTNQHGGDIWFTQDTLFGGPVHTNQNFNFYRSPWFGGAVTSAGCRQITDGQCGGQVRAGANFYYFDAARRQMRQEFRTVAQMGNAAQPRVGDDPSVAAPVFQQGVDWSAPFVPMPSGFENCLDGTSTCGQTQRVSEQQYEAGRDGLLFGNLHSLTLSRGADGKQYVRAQTAGSPAQVVEYRFGSDHRMELRRGNGAWETAFKVPYSPELARDAQLGRHAGQWVTASERDALIAANPRAANVIGGSAGFNGVVFSTGRIERLSGPPRGTGPAVAQFAQLTVAAQSEVRITGDVTYEAPPCSGSNTRGANGTVTPAPCGNLNARNVLGIYAIDGNVSIGNQNADVTLNAPDNLNLHASVMSAHGSVAVENFNQGGPRGTVNLVGGLIQNSYGAFGTFNSANPGNATGYSRNFVYDQRLGLGARPPKFPRPEAPWAAVPDGNAVSGIWRRVEQ